ncbi:hypothetical protein EYF80_066108 [Liparis tanakae]|uniref:Uncharacterized protein n=1 Tax=Liparis tanakae TaxID=230148 RepID=A0A4Z2E5A9_9TELE|nr:hypothetical protein EYF80_066108 [Liparis tanakae]
MQMSSGPVWGSAAASLLPRYGRLETSPTPSGLPTPRRPEVTGRSGRQLGSKDADARRALMESDFPSHGVPFLDSSGRDHVTFQEKTNSPLYHWFCTRITDYRRDGSVNRVVG